MTAQLSRDRRDIIEQTANHIISRKATSEHSENLKAVAELALLALAGMDSEPVDVPGMLWKMEHWRGAPCNGVEWAKGYQAGWNKYHQWLGERRAAMLKAGPVAATTVPDGWSANSDANDALVMLDRIDTVDCDDDERIESVKSIIRRLAAAPVVGDFRENENSSTNNFRENAETSTNCPCCGRKPLKNKTCSVSGCDGKHVARGFCMKHYAIERRKEPSRRESIRSADKRYRARKAAAPEQEV